jgi:hypothetical protein
MDTTEMSLIADFANKVPEEWEYFQKFARRFEQNTLEDRYGILPMGAKTDWNSMIYAKNPRELRTKHIEYLMKHPESLEDTISGFVQFLNWLEVKEGKKVR